MPNKKFKIILILLFAFGFAQAKPLDCHSVDYSNSVEELLKNKPQVEINKHYCPNQICDGSDSKDQYFKIKEDLNQIIEETKSLPFLEDHNLTLNEKISIYLYTARYSSFMNTTLKYGSDEDLKKVLPLICSADSGLSKIENYHGPVIRWDNVANPETVYQKGQLLVWKAFGSTSYDLNFKWGLQTKFIIQSLTGKKIDSYSAHPHEKEVLFRPNTQFIVESIETENVDDGFGQRTVTVIHLTETANPN